MIKVETNYDDWANKAQAGELDFHKKSTFRKDGSINKETEAMLGREFGFSPLEFAGKTVLDAGCGSVLRSKFFEGSHIIAIDPLIDEFLKLEWNDLHEASVLLSIPLEQYMEDFAETADFIMSINVLDHCYDFGACIKNLHHYLKDDGKCFLSFDVHEDGVGLDDMHPLNLNNEICTDIFLDAGFWISDYTRRKAYGGGGYALNYWMVKDV